MTRIREIYRGLAGLIKAYRECETIQDKLILTMCIVFAFSSAGKWTFNKSKNNIS